jgi:hypothetical protein
VSRKQSPINGKPLIKPNHHSTLDNSDILPPNLANDQEPLDGGRGSLGLGPHNTMGTTLMTTTSGVNTSNISPYK